MLELKENPKSVIAEAYRALRTNIQYSSFDSKIKSIIITSANQSEGKSTTVANLALAMAQDKKKVIVLDCDLRKPSLHRVFNVANVPGLSDVLLGKVDIRNTIFEIEDGAHLLTAGKMIPNPSEMLGSHLMEQLIRELKIFYDYIIIDSPPVLAVTDAQILANKVDGTIVVVRAEKTKRDNVINSKKALEKVNANIIGVVLNDVVDERSQYAYYAYGK